MTSKTRHRNEPDNVGRGKAAALVYPQKLVEWTALVGRLTLDGIAERRTKSLQERGGGIRLRV